MECHRHHIARLYVGCGGYNLNGVFFANIHLAHLKFIRIGMFFHAQNPANHHIRDVFSRHFVAFHFGTGVSHAITIRFDIR